MTAMKDENKPSEARGGCPVRGLPGHLLATWFGAGLAPKAPGTWGTLAALPFAWVMHDQYEWPVLAIATVAVTLIGIWAARDYMAETGEHDSGAIVIDEVAGMWLTLLPAAFLMPMQPDPVVYGIGFVLFRFFDIIKVWPASWADQSVSGGLGVMLDDIFAGLYAAVGVAGYLLFMGG